ncbi:MAG TPA: hypothetical protein VHG10_00695 [Glycomyces sp.]|nr:hypothetical protein [Glycomyces sp.]
MSTDHCFTTDDVHALLAAAVTRFNPGLGAHVSVIVDPDASVIELTPVEDGETLIGTERFRVTVERIGESR